MPTAHHGALGNVGIVGQVLMHTKKPNPNPPAPGLSAVHGGEGDAYQETEPTRLAYVAVGRSLTARSPGSERVAARSPLAQAGSKWSRSLATNFSLASGERCLSEQRSRAVTFLSLTSGV